VVKTPKGAALHRRGRAGAARPGLSRCRRLILEHRSLSKLRSTYTDKLPERIDPDTGRVHTSYHQAVASTGRLSSSDPNLQNIPIRTEEGRRIRQAFVAPEGRLLVAATTPRSSCASWRTCPATPACSRPSPRADIHRATAAEVFGVPLEE
jgi:DNA polymerase I